MQKFLLFTNSFKRYDPDTGVAVRSSNGFPRFVRYDLRHAVPETYPTWQMVKGGDPQEVFAEKYRALLTGRGLDVLASRFRAIATAEGDERLVLLCYEDLPKGDWCHRTVFAQWWHDMTGEQVVELGPPPPVPNPYTQDSLDV